MRNGERAGHLVGIFQYQLPPANNSTLPYARRGQAFVQPRIKLWVIGPRSVDLVDTVLDIVAECCLFPEWVAWRVGLRQSAASPQVLMGSSVSMTGVLAW